VSVLWITLKKELKSYFFSPVGWVIAVLFYLFRGFDVQATIARHVAAGLDRDLFSTYYVFGPSTNFMIVLVPPILTMRCFAEEKRTGSLEVLMTAPVRDVEIVLGKWLAAVAYFALLWLPTFAILWVLTLSPFLGQELAFGPVVASYVGLSLLGGLLLSVGCFTSSLTDNQLLASLSAMLFGSALLAAPAILDPMLRAEGAPEFAAKLVQQANVIDHLTNWFSRGLVDFGQVGFYLVGTALFLFLTMLTLGSRQWR
jgi:ABC-2 type transport system permease protein